MQAFDPSDFSRIRVAIEDYHALLININRVKMPAIRGDNHIQNTAYFGGILMIVIEHLDGLDRAIALPLKNDDRIPACCIEKNAIRRARDANAYIRVGIERNETGCLPKTIRK